MPPKPIIISNASGQEVGTSWGGISSMYGGMGGPGYIVGPWMYGTGVTPWGARDDPPAPRAIDIRRMLIIDAKAQQIYEGLTQSIRSASWQITDGYQAAWCREWIAGLDPSMDELIAQMATATAFARAVFEEVWDTTPDGRVTPIRMGYRPPDNTRIELDQYGKVSSVSQQIEGKTVPIPLERVLMFVHNQHRAPGLGVSDMEPVYAMHWTKLNIVRMWRLYLARMAAPWAVAKAEVQDVTAMQSLAQRVASLKSGGVVGMGPAESVEFVEASNAQNVFSAALEWCDRQMTAATLLQFLDLGQSRVGSFALSQDHSDFYTLGRDAMLREMAACLTDQLVQRAVLANWPDTPRDQLPTFRFEPLAEADATRLTTLLGQIIAAPQINPAVPQNLIEQIASKAAAQLGLDVNQLKASLGGGVSPVAVNAASRALQVLQGAQPAGNGTAPTPAA